MSEEEELVWCHRPCGDAKGYELVHPKEYQQGAVCAVCSGIEQVCYRYRRTREVPESNDTLEGTLLVQQQVREDPDGESVTVSIKKAHLEIPLTEEAEEAEEEIPATDHEEVAAELEKE